MKAAATSPPPLSGVALEVDRVARGEHWDPFEVLGPQADGQTWLVRVVAPDARAVWFVPGDDTSPAPMQKIHAAGVFEIRGLSAPAAAAYRLRIHDDAGEREIEDPYRFPPLLTDFDLHLIGEGTEWQLYEKLGAHLREVEGATGVHFAVWAPNAKRVSVVGDFNRWHGLRHAMRARGGSGVWELFIPGLGEGELYKFEIKSRLSDTPFTKTDPLGFRFELRPKTAAITCRVDDYAWGDGEWMSARARWDWQHAPLSVYEVHLGSWMRVPEENGRPLTYRELAPRLADYVLDLGYTHIELLPIAEHPFDPSWGYQTTGYYAPTSRFGTPRDFMSFVDHLHQRGIGVLLDWTPAHFPRDEFAMAGFDGTHLYEHGDPRKGEHRDWGTLIFNYGRNEVRNFLLANALFWLDRYHIDGLRVDAVASMLYLDYSRHAGDWIPNIHGGRENLEAVEFIKKMNELVHQLHPGAITTAEESTSWPAVSRPVYLGGLGFSMKWNMGWMNDILAYVQTDPVFRKYRQQNLTFALLYAFTENFVLPLSHDEVVHRKRALLDKMPGDVWQRLANLRLLYAYMYTHPGKKLLFMGGEFGQWREWNERESLDWHLLADPAHAGVQQLVRDINRLYRAEPALHEVDFEWPGFEWIDFHDVENSVVAFLRRARDPDDFVIVACNFTPVPRTGYRLGVPRDGFYQEILNTDAAVYGGSNLGNAGGLPAEPRSWQGRPASILITLPPLAAVVFKPK